MAAVDYFLQIDGVQGESPDAKHKGAIDLQSFEWGESNRATPPAGGGGGGAGRLDMQPIRVLAESSKASPVLLLACATGQHLKQAVLTVRKAGKNQAEYIVIRLTDVTVASYELIGRSDGGPLDSVSFGYAKFEIEYRPQKADGSLSAAVKAAWDLRANKKI